MKSRGKERRKVQWPRGHRPITVTLFPSLLADVNERDLYREPFAMKNWSLACQILHHAHHRTERSGIQVQRHFPKMMVRVMEEEKSETCASKAHRRSLRSFETNSRVSRTANKTSTSAKAKNFSVVCEMTERAELPPSHAGKASSSSSTHTKSFSLPRLPCFPFFSAFRPEKSPTQWQTHVKLRLINRFGGFFIRYRVSLISRCVCTHQASWQAGNEWKSTKRSIHGRVFWPSQLKTFVKMAKKSRRLGSLLFGNSLETLPWPRTFALTSFNAQNFNFFHVRFQLSPSPTRNFHVKRELALDWTL